MPTDKQEDVVVETRELLNSIDKNARVVYALKLLKVLADEVERLREQWNTRFNTLCGLCGKRYLGPRDEDLHGYGACDMKGTTNAN